MREYNQSVAESQVVMDAMQKVIGDTVIPGLIKMANWFKSVGPQAVQIMNAAMAVYVQVMDVVSDAISDLFDIGKEVFIGLGEILHTVFGQGGHALTGMEQFKNILKAVQIAIIAMALVAKESLSVITLAVDLLVVGITEFSRVAAAAFVLNWNGVKQAWAEGSKAAADAVQRNTERMVKAVFKAHDDMKAIALDGAIPPKKDEKKKKGEEEHDKKWQPPPGDEKPEKSKMPEIEAELEARKMKYMKEHDLREMSKADEIAYLEWEKENYVTSASDMMAISKKIDEVKIASMKEVRKATEEQNKARIEGEAKVAEAAFGNTSAAIKAAEEAGSITKAQAIRAEGLVQDAILQIKIQAIQKQMDAIRDKQSAEYIKLNSEKLVLENKAASDSIAVAGNAVKAIKAENDKMFADFGKSMQPMTSAWDKALEGMLNKTTSWHKAQRQIALGVVQSFEKMGIDTLNGMITNEAKKLILAQLSQAKQDLIEKDGLAKTLGNYLLDLVGFKSAEAAKTTAAGTAAVNQASVVVAGSAPVILANAGVAASGAAAAVAPTPWVGPALAAAAFVGTLALVKTATHSAEGGFDIPAGLNPLTQLHSNEMVLPSNLADNIRNMTGGGGEIHLHVHSMDTQNVKEFLNRHGSTIMDTIQRQARSFNPGKAQRP